MTTVISTPTGELSYSLCTDFRLGPTMIRRPYKYALSSGYHSIYFLLCTPLTCNYLRNHHLERHRRDDYFEFLEPGELFSRARQDSDTHTCFNSETKLEVPDRSAVSRRCETAEQQSEETDCTLLRRDLERRNHCHSALEIHKHPETCESHQPC